MSVVVHRLIFGMVVLASVWLSGCGTPVNRAPVENRGTYAATTTVPATVANMPPTEPERPSLPGVENEGRPGYYTVRPGDTLIRIGLETGQYWKDLAQWNQLENPDILLIGQVVRVVPPVADDGTTATPVEGGVVATPVAVASVTPTPPTAGANSSKQTSSTKQVAKEEKPAVAALPLPSESPTTTKTAGGIQFAWPASGPTLAKFHADLNKGLDIGGNAGDPVLAAADGRVVYAGSELRGYGNLIIVKHNDTYLTAYAHNQKLLVKEEQNVKRGQKIAEMGKSDADRVKLHFEIRRKGTPIDPMQHLPKR